MYGRKYENTYVLDLTQNMPGNEQWAKLRRWYKNEDQYIKLENRSFCHDRRMGRMQAFIEPNTASKLSNMQYRLTPSSRLYIMAHGIAGGRSVSHTPSRNSEEISIKLLARFLSEILKKPDFKVNLGPKNLVISLMTCNAAESTETESSIATKLQQALKSDYGIYVNILARNGEVGLASFGNGYFKYTGDIEVERKEFFLATIDARSKKQYHYKFLKNHHKVAGSKLFFCWGYNGEPIVYDAYSYRNHAKTLDELRSDLLLNLSQIIQRDSNYKEIAKFIDNSDPAHVIQTCLSQAYDKKHRQIYILNNTGLVYKAIAESGYHHKKHHLFFNTMRQEQCFHSLCKKATKMLEEFKDNYCDTRARMRSTVITQQIPAKI